MTKTYLDVLTKRGIDLFLTEDKFEELRKFNPKTEYAIPGLMTPVFRSPKQHQIEVGKNSNLIADMCWYGATEAELMRISTIWIGGSLLRTLEFRNSTRNTAGLTGSLS